MGDSSLCEGLWATWGEIWYVRTSHFVCLVQPLTISFRIQDGIEDLLWGRHPCWAVDHVLPLSYVAPVMCAPCQSCNNLHQYL
jgi:hypothetical protein